MIRKYLLHIQLCLFTRKHCNYFKSFESPRNHSHEPMLTQSFNFIIKPLILGARRCHCLLYGNDNLDLKMSVHCKRHDKHTLFVCRYHTRFEKPLVLPNIKIVYDTAIANLSSIVNFTRGTIE